MKYYNLGFEKLKEIQFDSLDPFLFDRITKESNIFHIICSDSTGYIIMASNTKTIDFGDNNDFKSVLFNNFYRIRM